MKRILLVNASSVKEHKHTAKHHRNKYSIYLSDVKERNNRREQQCEFQRWLNEGMK